MAIDTEPESTSVIRSSFGPGGTANEKGRLWTIHGDFGDWRVQHGFEEIGPHTVFGVAPELTSSQ